VEFLPRRYIPMTYKQMEIQSLTIKEMQIETTMIYHFTPTDGLQSKRQETEARMWKNWPPAGGM
jgi:hypothetical protein